MKYIAYVIHFLSNFKFGMRERRDQLLLRDIPIKFEYINNFILDNLLQLAFMKIYNK